jgi:hypothetical protein
MPPPAILLLLAFGSLALVGCSEEPQANLLSAAVADNPYYLTIPNLSNPEDFKNVWAEYGYCEEHGFLTSPSTDTVEVTKWVNAHNDRYHRDGHSPYWAKVYRAPN